jgi:HK97 family phage prohead protease
MHLKAAMEDPLATALAKFGEWLRRPEYVVPVYDADGEIAYAERSRMPPSVRVVKDLEAIAATQQRFSPSFFLKQTDFKEDGEFLGYASTFDLIPDSYGDVIAPGAFTKTLETHKARGTMPALLWSHDQAEPIGKWLDLSEDRNGLLAHGKLALGIERAAQAHELMKAGSLALSIGYRLASREDQSCNGEMCVLGNLELFEVSVVAIPANYNARILAVKKACECGSIREFEDLVRDSLGLSARQAVRVAAAAWPALGDRDDRNAAQPAQIGALTFDLLEINQFLKGYQKKL